MCVTSLMVPILFHGPKVRFVERKEDLFEVYVPSSSRALSALFSCAATLPVFFSFTIIYSSQRMHSLAYPNLVIISIASLWTCSFLSLVSIQVHVFSDPYRHGYLHDAVFHQRNTGEEFRANFRNCWIEVSKLSERTMKIITESSVWRLVLLCMCLLRVRSLMLRTLINRLNIGTTARRKPGLPFLRSVLNQQSKSADLCLELSRFCCSSAS